MTLRKITIDNSVRYVPKNDKTEEKEIKPKTTKAGLLSTKQNENISQKSKKIPEKCSSKWIWYS